MFRTPSAAKPKPVNYLTHTPYVVAGTQILLLDACARVVIFSLISFHNLAMLIKLIRNRNTSLAYYIQINT